MALPTTTSRRRSAAVLTGLVCTLGVLTGCGDDTATPDGSPETSTSASATPDGASTSSSPSPSDANTIQITFEGDTVTPNGERVEVARGEEITLEVTADAPGELHVHATPEQELPYEAGTSELTLTIDEPGIVEVESHELEVIVVQLEVS